MSLAVGKLGEAVGSKIAEIIKERLPDLPVLPYPAGSFADLPVLTVGTPSLFRRGIDEAESSLGRNDWVLAYPIELYVAMDDRQSGSALAMSLMMDVTAALDTNSARQLNAELPVNVVDTIVSSFVPQEIPSEPLDEETQTRPALLYAGVVETMLLIPSNTQ